MLNSAFWMWSILAVVLLVGEIFTAGFFLLPFGLGAAIAALLAFLGFSPLWQTITFVAVSAVAFLLLRKLADKMTHDPPQMVGIDRLIGKQGVVTEVLTPDSSIGQIWVEREEWRADAPGCGSVPVGTQVQVQGVEGTHLIVTVLEQTCDTD